MQRDDLVWQKLDEDTDQWDKSIRTKEVYRSVGNFILKYKDGPPEQMHLPVRGAYNTIYRLEYKDGSSVIMRIPIKGVVQFPDEKVLYEVATMRYVAAHTTIPVPYIYHYGTAAENPTGLGSFIIMDYIDHHQNMSRALLDPERGIDERPVLNPNITNEKLEVLYGQMANILLQLSTLKFPRIGSLIEKKAEGSISANGRPLIANMNDIVVHTNTPANILPSQTYASAGEWYSALGDMHLAQLVFQHNDVVEDKEDACDKYVARQLFRNLAAKGRLVPEPSKSDGEFRLFSEDFRPANVLLDKDLQVVGVIDWEFAYAAPSQCSFDPPWWLLLQEPEYWTGGYREWMKVYEPRLQTFLRMLELEENKMTAFNLAEKVNAISLTDNRETEPPLSQRMQESWDKRTWMLNYAARKSWAFDFIWWKFLDESYFGPNENQDCRARLGLLSEPQTKVMEFFVARKMEESGNRKVIEWSDENAADRLAEVLI
ncbi:phosphotransferase family protein [Ilyonectria robusta]|uniref:phosphotransferase family protein n=1 Tax=Ilyonectria robusta TaxID=1079257 RepID=UPI001E8D4105|nr:phosphotransferase family protein [Ilyonectria robusta]KAH8729212.1 phosphotransferase family protein [Ilyonectria robusta]